MLPYCIDTTWALPTVKAPILWTSGLQMRSVPDLMTRKGLTSWKAVCTLLRIDTAGDSARRKLKNWVKSNRPGWPAVPDIN